MLRFSSRFEDRDGYQKRIGPRFEGFFPTPAGSYDESDAFDDAHNLLFRVQARSVLRDGLEVRLIGQYSSQQGNGPAIHLLGNPNVSMTTGCAVNLNCVPGVGTRFARTSPDPRRTYSDYPGYRDDWQGFASAQLRWDVEHDALGPLRIDARFGFNRDSVDQAYDSDLTYAAATIVFPTSEARQYSGEVSIRSVDSRPWDWRLGALYWQEQVATDNAVDANGSIPGGDGRILNEIENRTVSAMGEADYWLTDTLRLGAGFNWSQDDKEVIARRRGFSAFGLGSVRSQQTFSKPAWKALVDWQWAPASRVVLRASSGFKAGGFPLGAQCDGENICEPFGQEEVVLYELTSKNDFFDERLRLNVTLFWTEHEPFQVCLAAGISFRCASRGDATSRGVEVELSAFPVPELQITGNFNILDARVDRHRLVDPLEIRFPPGDAPLKERENPLNGFAQDLSGNTIERSPKYNLSLLVRYDLGLATVGLPDWGTLSPQIQYQYQTRTYYRIFNIEQNSQGPFSLVNLRLLWRSRSSRWSVEGFVDNVTDNDVINFLTVGAGPELRAAYNRPRWTGLRVGFSY
jgi:iron complex outermembrane receptor protein